MTEAEGAAEFAPVARTFRLHTARCVLRHPRAADAGGMVRAATDPRYPDYDPWSRVKTLDLARRRLARQTKRWSAQQGFTFSIDRKADGAFLGQVSISHEPEPRTWMLGYWLVPDAWGDGLATEVGACVVSFAFGALGAESLWAGVVPENAASRRILEKLEFVRRGENPAAYELDGVPIATHEFERTRDPGAPTARPAPRDPI